MCRRQALRLAFVLYGKEQSVGLLMERTVLSRAADARVAGEEREGTDWLCLHVCCALK